MKDEELKLAIHDLSIKYGDSSTMKKKLCLILNELLARTTELDKRYPIKNPVGRPKKEE